jgi:hypothetical protein
MAERAGRQLSLADVFAHFGETDVRGASPLYEAVSLAIAASPEALAAIEQAPPLKRHPTVILAALHDLVLQGKAPELAEAYVRRDAATAGPAGVSALVALSNDVVAIAARRQTQTNETGRGAVLYPAITEAAHRVGADSIALIDVGCSAGLNLTVDHADINYSDGSHLGDEASPLQLACQVTGERAVPNRSMPTVVSRIGIDLNPVDPSDPADARWLRACLWPDQPERIARLDAAIALAARHERTLLPGDALERLPDAFAMVPNGALPVVMTTWALAYFSHEDRLRFLRRLDERAARGPLAWVSAEGVGIAPAVPTMGDSRMAAHSVVGIAVADGPALRVDAVGRCHPHGQWLEWVG